MRKTVLLSLVAVLCVCLFGLVACNKVEAESVDYNNVALNGLTKVTIDKTETFDILDGVTAVYKYSDGTEKYLTSEIRYVLPAQANFVGGGIVLLPLMSAEIMRYRIISATETVIIPLSCA